MILKGSQRAGAKQLSAHLLNERDNEHVRVHELRGFAADDLHGALAEAHAVSKGTKCKQFMFSLSLNPPKGVTVGEARFRESGGRGRAGARPGRSAARHRLSRKGRPPARACRVVADRCRHHARGQSAAFQAEADGALARVCFSNTVGRCPMGCARIGGKSPLNFTLAEWQQAKRLGRDPREIKDVFRDAWEQSDSLKALGNALAERGYFLAQGDRGFVAVDTDGEIYALAKWAGVKVREARAKLGEAADAAACRSRQGGGRRSSSPPSSKPLRRSPRQASSLSCPRCGRSVDAMRDDSRARARIACRKAERSAGRKRRKSAADGCAPDCAGCGTTSPAAPAQCEF